MYFVSTNLSLPEGRTISTPWPKIMLNTSTVTHIIAELLEQQTTTIVGVSVAHYARKSTSSQPTSISTELDASCMMQHTQQQQQPHHHPALASSAHYTPSAHQQNTINTSDNKEPSSFFNTISTWHFEASSRALVPTTTAKCHRPWLIGGKHLSLKVAIC